MDDDGDKEGHQDSIIPPIALELALSGSEVPRIVKKRKNVAVGDPNVEIEESPEEERKPPRRKKNSQQTSLENYITLSSNDGHWKPVRKQPSAKAKVEIVRKKIVIDPQETPRSGKLSEVVVEVSSEENSEDLQQVRMEESIERAKRRSIKHYFNEESQPKLSKTSEDGSSNSSATPRTNPNETLSLSQPSNRELTTTADEEEVEVNEAVTGDDEIIVVESSLSTTEEDRMKDLEVVLVQHESSSRSKKRARFAHRHRHSADNDFLTEHRPRTSYSTPRRKLSCHRSFSNLNFLVDELDFDIPSTPTIRRRRPNGESSIFDLGIRLSAGKETRTPGSAPASVTECVRNIHLNEVASVANNEEDDDERSIELGDSPVPSSTSLLQEDSCTPAKGHIEGKISVETTAESADVAAVAARASYSETPDIVVSSIVNSQEKTIVGIPPASSASDDDEIIVLETVPSTPSKSLTLTELLYSPRKMELTNAKRLETILSKARNRYETEPILNNLASNTDYCAFQVSTLSEEAPPEPQPKSCVDMDLNFNEPGFVRLPWSTANINNGFHQYVIIDRALRALVYDGAHRIEAVIVTLKECAPWIRSFDGLIGFMDGLSMSEERQALDIMAGIAKLAVNAKFIITAPIPRLTANRPGSVTLSQEQCACLLAHAFYCTFRRERSNYNRINFAGIFDGGNPLSHVKLRFILNYFAMVLKKMPTGCVSFQREVVLEETIPKWVDDETSIPLVAVARDGSIEDSFGCLQVDFANAYIGGGVLNSGAVQEEIRFLICPEMIVSCLLCERMGPLEAIRIVGAQRYSDYMGYGETLEWSPLENYGDEPRDEFCRVVCEVVAMDAKLYKPMARRVQYTPENINRELNKAYTAFLSNKKESRPIATGNWGCGVFGGDRELKSLIQMIAAARVGRDMIYYTFSNEIFEQSLNEHYEKLIQRKATIGNIYKALMTYWQERERNSKLTVFEHVYGFISQSACTTS